MIQGDYEAAICELDQAIRFDKNKSDAFYERGLIYFKLKQDEKALLDFYRAVLIEMREENLNHHLSEDSPEFANLIDALENFKNGIASDPKDYSSCMQIGIALSETKNYLYAKKILQIANELFSGNPLTLHELGLIYFLDDDLDNAILLATQAIEIEPENASLFVSRGKYYYANEDISSALVDFERASLLDPEKFREEYLEILEEYE